MGILLVAVTAAVTTSLSLAIVHPLLARRALDIPTERSSHTTPIPRGGGLGVVVGALIAAGVAKVMGNEPIGIVLAALAVMAVVGLVEDLHGVPISVRLGVQALVSLSVVALLGPTELTSFLLLPVVVTSLVGYCNAFNFMDGIDGISAFTVLIVAAWYAGVAHSIDASSTTVTCALLAGAVLGFVPWNLPRARLFLGDTGSYALGMAIPVLGLGLRAEGAAWPAVLAPLLVYVADVAWTLLRRLRRRQPWHQAHREHVYQRLAAKLGHLSTAVIVAAFTASCCAVWFIVSPHLFAAAMCWLGLVTVYLSQPAWWRGGDS